MRVPLQRMASAGKSSRPRLCSASVPPIDVRSSPPTWRRPPTPALAEPHSQLSLSSCRSLLCLSVLTRKLDPKEVKRHD
jgi:hypothetical protein